MASKLLAERTYKLLREYFLELDARNGDDFWSRQIALGSHSEIFIDHHMRNSTGETKLFVLMIDCMEDIRQSKAKTDGIHSIDKIMNKTCKENAKLLGADHQLIGGFHDEYGNSFVSNSYYLLKTNKNVSIPPVPNGKKFPASLLDILEKHSCENTEVINCPDLSTVKSYIRLKKAEQKKGTPVYFSLTYKDEIIWVDAEYLARIIEFMCDSNIVCKVTGDTSKVSLTPIYLTNNNGEEAILCPTRKY